MEGPANLLVNETGDQAGVSRTGKVCDKNVSSHMIVTFSPCSNTMLDRGTRSLPAVRNQSNDWVGHIGFFQMCNLFRCQVNLQ